MDDLLFCKVLRFIIVVERWCVLANAETKSQIGCATTAQLISDFVFATKTVLPSAPETEIPFRFISDLMGYPEDELSRRCSHYITLREL